MTQKLLADMSRSELESECSHLRQCYFSMKNSLEDAKTEHIINDLPFHREIRDKLKADEEDPCIVTKEYAMTMIDDWIHEMENS